MKIFSKQRVALCMVFFFLFSLTGCGGGGSGGGNSPQAQLEKEMKNFNTAMDWIVEDMVDLNDTTVALNQSLAEDDGSSKKSREISRLIDRYNDDVDALLASIETMEAAEDGIQDLIRTDEGDVQAQAIGVTIVGAALIIGGYFTFGKKMKEYGEDLKEGKKEEGEALEDIGNDLPGADEKLEEAKNKTNKAGEDALGEFGSKVTTDMVIQVNPTSLPGVVIKHIAGNEVQNGLKVLSTTKACEEQGYDSRGCKIGFDETGDTESVVVPGPSNIVVGGNDTARVVFEENVAPGSSKEVELDLTSIKEAAADMLPEEEENGEDPGDEDPGDTTPEMTLSTTVADEDATSITYNVAVAVSGVTGRTSVRLSVENAGTGGSTKTIRSDSTVIWSVTVLDQDATITVTRNDTGESQSLTLPGKTANYDGWYSGIARSTFQEEDYYCWDMVELSVYVSGNTISGSVTGTISGNRITGHYNEYSEIIFTGEIKGNVMDGTWYDSVDGNCSGTFRLTKQ